MSRQYVTPPVTLDYPESTLEEVVHKLSHLRHDDAYMSGILDPAKNAPASPEAAAVAAEAAKRLANINETLKKEIARLEKLFVDLATAEVAVMSKRDAKRAIVEIERVTGKKFKPIKTKTPSGEEA